MNYFLRIVLSIVLIGSLSLFNNSTKAQCTITTFPYTENFDTVSAPTFPCGWTVTNDNSDAYEWSVYGSEANSVPNSVAIQYNLDQVTAMDDWFFSPGLQLQAGTTYELQFYYKVGGAIYPENLDVFLGDGQSAADMNTNLFTGNNISNATYQIATRQFTATSTGTFYIGFHGYSAADQYFIFVDDFSITEISQTCPAPTGLTASNFTSTSAEISWSSSGNNFELEYGPFGFSPGSGTVVSGISDTSETISGLSADTTYQIYVRQVCGPGDTSNYAGPETFVLNDDCIYAIPAVCNSTLSGTTIGASLSAPASNCGAPVNTAGVWYTFTGTGNTISATTCDPLTDFDTRLSVFSGSCGSLVCIDENDDFNGCGTNVNFSQVSWNSVAGQTYYILVHGFNGSTGNFELTVNAQGIANAGQDQTICLGDSATLSASGGAQYSWNTGANSASITVGPNGTTDYSVTVTSANGCVDADTLTVFATDSADGGTVLTETGLDSVNICIDGNADLIRFDSTNNATTGAAYTYIITDATNTTILATPSGDEADFDAFGTGETHVWGISYVGNLTAQAGQPVASITADVCFELSSNFIKVIGDSTDAGTDIQVLNNGTPADSIQICLDNIADPLSFTNNGNASANSDYSYIATDENDIVLSSFTGALDFNQFDPGTAKVYGASYIGTLSATNGQPLSNVTASVCVDISTDFAEVFIDSADGGSVTLQNGDDTTTVCLGSGNTVIQLDSVTQATAGAQYTYIATDASNTTVLGQIPGDQLDVTGVSPGEYHLWGISYVGNLNIPTTPTSLSSITSDFCFELSSDFVVLFIDSAIVDAGNDQTICEGDTAVLTATGNGSFEWSNGATTATTSVNPAQTTDYIVTVTTAQGCEINDTLTVNANPNPVVSLPDPSICPGSSTILNAGNAGASFNWSNGDQTQTISVNAAGDYSVTVTDVNNCSASDTATVSIGQGLGVTLADAEICQGDTAVLDAGFAGSTYNWSNGDQTQSIQVTTAGDYSVTVTDPSGCTGSDTATVTVNALPTADAGTDQNICDGNSATLTATGGIDYNWSNGVNNASIVVAPLQTTSYTVTVTDANSCSDTDNVIVNVNPNPTINLPDPSICAGSSTVLDAGNPGATFNWSTGDQTQTITVSSADSYSVTVTDGNNCISSDTAVVSVGASLNVDLGGDYEFCQGDSVILDAQNPGATYDWSNGAQTQTITVNSGGSYSVTVTDNNNCSGADTSQITVNALPSADAGQDQDICQGESATLSASGGTSYSWSTGDQTQAISVSPIQTTTYTVTVTDNNNCQASDDVNVAALTTPSVSLPDPSICLGSFTVLDAGNPGATYNWSTGEQTQSISVTTAGSYTVTVTAANNCSAVDTAIVSTGNALVVDLGGDYDICQGNSVVLDAGNPGANYNWSTGAQTQTITVTTDGSYSVTVSDNNNCSGSDTSNVTVNLVPVADAGADQQICAGDTTQLTASGGATYQWSNNQSGATINVAPTTTTTYTVTVTSSANCTNTDDVTVSVNPAPTVNIPDASFCPGTSTVLDAGNPGATYNWSTGDQTQTITVSTIGNYSVTVTDNNNCSAADTAVVSQSNNLTVNLGNPLACVGDTITLDAANPGSDYLWNTGDTTQTIQVSSSGTYTVTVANGNCTGSDNVTLNFQPAPTASVSNDTTICSGASVVLTASGGTSYEWSNGSINNSISVTPTQTTTYSVTVSNANNCTDTEEVTVNVATASTAPSLSSSNNNFCAGGSATLSITGGTLGSGAKWYWYAGSCGGTPIDSGSTVSVTPAVNTDYFVRGEGPCNLTACASVNLTVFALPNANAGSNDTICQGETSRLTATGGGSYLWSNSETSDSISVTPNITTPYSVTVTNSNNCSAADTALVVVNPAPLANAGVDEEICAGSSVTLSAVGGIAYDWSNGAQTDTNSVAPTNDTDYIVTVTNAEGCEANDTVSVTVNALPSVDITDLTAVCIGDDPVSLSGTPVGGNFSGNGVSNSEFLPSSAGEGTFTIYYSFTDGNNCTAQDSTEVTVNICPGIEEEATAFNSVAVFPNPFDQQVQIELDVEKQTDVLISLTDLNGKQVLQKEESIQAGAQTLRLNTTQVLSNGLYFLEIRSASFSKTFRLIRTQ